MRADTLSWISSQDEAAAPWYESTVLGSSVLWLTQDEAKELGDDILAAIDQAPRRTAEEAPPGSRQVRVTVAVVPMPADGSRPSPSPPTAPAARPRLDSRRRGIGPRRPANPLSRRP